MEGLPIVQAVVSVYNPQYTPGDSPLFINKEREVEVLSLNLTTGTMRVRYTDIDTYGTAGKAGKAYNKTTDVSIDSFFNSYTITKKAAQ